MSLKKRIKLITAVSRLAYQENKPIGLILNLAAMILDTRYNLNL